MKLIDIRSAFAGAGLVAGIFGLVSITTAPPPYHVFHIQIEGVPTPNQMMRVVEGVPFTVPEGKLFVVAEAASRGSGTDSTNRKDSFIEFDGEVVYAVRLSTGDGYPSHPVVGLVAPAGTVVSVREENDLGTDQGLVLGYLADA